jgi:hypothetical protein
VVRGDVAPLGARVKALGFYVCWLGLAMFTGYVLAMAATS